jgi:hypothetical protein
MGVVKNITDSAKIATSATGTAFTILTNPFFWIILGILFFPLDIINYAILVIVNTIILVANILLFAIQLLIFAIFAVGVMLINVVIGLVNSISFTIPLPDPFDDIEINLPDLPFLSMPSFPSFGVIPYSGIDDVRLFDSGGILLLKILDFFNISFPF